LISFDGDQDTLHIPHTRTERTNRDPDYVSSTPIRRTERLWVRIDPSANGLAGLWVLRGRSEGVKESCGMEDEYERQGMGGRTLEIVM
jgi:hypothetical protein